MAKGLVEILTKVGDSNITLQMLGACACGARQNKEGNTEISFVTTQISPAELAMNEGKIGMIVWVDKEILRESAK